MWVAWIVMGILPLIVGSAVAIRIEGNESRVNVSANYLLGTLTLFLIIQIVATLSVLGGFSFAVFSRLVTGILLCAVLITGIYAWIALRKQHKDDRVPLFTKQEVLWSVILISLFVYQAWHMATRIPILGKDSLLEVMQTTLMSGELLQVHPFTGAILEVGMTKQGMLLTLPMVYAYVADFFALSADVFLYQVLPVFLLFLMYQLQFAWAKILFPLEKEKQRIFVLTIAFLLMFGEYTESTMATIFLHGSYLGESIAYLFLVPYGILLGMQRGKVLSWIGCVIALVAMVPLKSALSLIMFGAIISIGIQMFQKWIERKNICKDTISRYF